MVNDTIADMLTRVRNANLARHKIVQIPSTKMTRSITSVLFEEGFIENFEEIGDGKKTKTIDGHHDMNTTAITFF